MEAPGFGRGYKDMDAEIGMKRLARSNNEEKWQGKTKYREER